MLGYAKQKGYAFMFKNHVYGIDLGSNMIKIYSQNSNEILKEKNMIAIRNKDTVLAVGDEAYEIYEKNPTNVKVSSPMLNGMIANISHLEIMLQLLLDKTGRSVGRHPVIYFAVPVDMTEIEKRAYYSIAHTGQLRQSKVLLVERPIADALALGIPIMRTKGSMIVNIGAATTEISVIADTRVIISKVIPVGGDRLTQDILTTIRRKLNFSISERTAGRLKVSLANLEKVKINKRPVSISDIHPLWMKHPNECTDEDYKTFYRKVFMDYKEPLFWIHLNMDYPFNLKGILYFPKINTEYDSIEGTIKLYNNQVFIADNIKEVIPEFLMLLKGVIDCPDLPLNVSRSALQNDGFVKKISDYISKKVADKLTGMCKTAREDYEKYWDDISPFIKFGCIKDAKFSDKMDNYILFKNLDGKYLTLKDCIEENKKPEAETAEAGKPEEEKKDGEQAEEKETEKTTVYYVSDEIQQSQYINMFKEQGMDAVILKHNIDTAFITHVEQKHEDVKFQRIDADLTEDFKEDGTDLKEMTDELTATFKKALNNEQLDVKVEKLKNESISSMMTLSEESRRMQDMMKMYGMDANMFGGANGATLVLNANHPLVKYVAAHKEDDKNVPLICQQLYDLAMMAHKQLSPDEMTQFIARSNQILLALAK